MFTFPIGSTVKINIEEEARGWGYNPFLEGTEVTVTGYSEIVYGRNQHYGHGPGVFENTSWCLVTDGKKTECVSTSYLKGERVRYEGKKLRDLPESSYWEGDVVQVTGRERGVICRIYYKSETMPDGPAYDVDTQGFGTMIGIRERDMTLVNRGHIWNEGHGIEPVFADMADHVKHERQVSRHDEIRNPATDLYSWTLPEVMAAIKSGIVDGFNVGGFMGFNSISAFKLHNEALGTELRAHMLAEFPDEVVAKLPEKPENSPFAGIC